MSAMRGIIDEITIERSILMFALGTIVNTLAILAGGICGLLFGALLGQRHQETLTRTCGVCTLFPCVSSVLLNMDR